LTDILIIVAVALLVAIIALLLVLLRKPPNADVSFLPAALMLSKRHRNAPSARSETRWPRAETNWVRRLGSSDRNSPKPSRSSVSPWYNE